MVEEVSKRVHVLKSIKELLGIDSAILLMVSSRLWSLLASPVTVLLTSTYLTSVEQGYFYTFNSVIGASVFLEFGLAVVLTQFVSHEMAKITWLPFEKPTGEPASLSRLSSIVQLGTVWYSISAIVFLATIIPFGFYYFSSQSPSAEVSWELPWTFLVIATAIGLVLSPVFASLEGAGFVALTSSYRLYQSVIATLCLWICLPLHGALFTLPIMASVSVIFSVCWLLARWRRPLVYLLTMPQSTNRVNYFREILPVHFQIALSWVSGYLSFYLCTPILFSQVGATAAGRYGMSLSLCLTMSALAQAWIYSKAPQMGKLIAERKFKELKGLFFTIASTSIIIHVLGTLAMICGVVTLNIFGSHYATRLLDTTNFCLLGLAWIFGHGCAILSIYLRSHKKDPLCYQSIVGGLFLAIGTYYFAGKYGVTGAILMQVAVHLLSLIGAVITTIHFTKGYRESP